MSPQKRITLSACALFIMLGLLSGGVAMLQLKKNEDTEVFSESDSLSQSTASEELFENQKFTLKIQDGVLVVFNEADNIRPFIVTDIYASTLRHSDRESLLNGIVVNGELELLSLLEDFSS